MKATHPSLLALALLCSCSQRVPLEYPSKISGRPAPEATSVAVYAPEDARPGFKPNVAAREQRLFTAELPITYASDRLSQKTVSGYVHEAITTELEQQGLRVVQVQPGAPLAFEAALRDPARLRTRNVDYVVFARINHESFYNAGFAGLLFQSSMNPARAYCDLDLAVLDAKTGQFRWVGEASAKIQTELTETPPPEQINHYLSSCLDSALTKVLTKEALLGALTR